MKKSQSGPGLVFEKLKELINLLGSWHYIKAPPHQYN